MIAVLFARKLKRGLIWVAKLFKTNFKSDVFCIHSEESHYLKEKLDEFISVYPNEKPASCLECFRKFSVKELQGILKHYHVNISGKKADLVMRTFAIFCLFQPKLNLDHTTCCTYRAGFSCKFSNAIWKNDIREIINFNFFSVIPLFCCYTEKYNGDLLRRTTYKRLKSFEFFMRVISTKWSYVVLNYLFMFILN